VELNSPNSFAHIRTAGGHAFARVDATVACSAASLEAVSAETLALDQEVVRGEGAVSFGE
jgi:hypothetical protein